MSEDDASSCINIRSKDYVCTLCMNAKEDDGRKGAIQPT